MISNKVPRGPRWGGAPWSQVVPPPPYFQGPPSRAIFESHPSQAVLAGAPLPGGSSPNHQFHSVLDAHLRSPSWEFPGLSSHQPNLAGAGKPNPHLLALRSARDRRNLSKPTPHLLALRSAQARRTATPAMQPSASIDRRLPCRVTGGVTDLARLTLPDGAVVETEPPLLFPTLRSRRLSAAQAFAWLPVPCEVRPVCPPPLWRWFDLLGASGTSAFTCMGHPRDPSYRHRGGGCLREAKLLAHSRRCRPWTPL